jgi:hypothetical protein
MGRVEGVYLFLDFNKFMTKFIKTPETIDHLEGLGLHAFMPVPGFGQSGS